MEKLFVPYELAVKLKEKGFNEKCIAFYSNNTDSISICKNINIEGNYIEIRRLPQRGTSAPAYFQVIDWIFEKLINNEDYREIIYAGSKPISEIDEEIKEALKLI